MPGLPWGCSTQRMLFEGNLSLVTGVSDGRVTGEPMLWPLLPANER